MVDNARTAIDCCDEHISNTRSKFILAVGIRSSAFIALFFSHLSFVYVYVRLFFFYSNSRRLGKNGRLNCMLTAAYYVYLLNG